MLENIGSLIVTDEAQIIIKLLLIIILAGLVGYERESWKKPAGFRTYVLVGLSSVLVMICGEEIFNKYGSDPTRIPAQLLSGIGFLGAGTILRDGFNVKGLTTAAALLAVTCIGLVVGAGFYMPAIAATFIVYCVLSYSHVLSDKLEHYNFVDLKISTQTPKAIINEVRDVFNEDDLEIVQIKISDDKEADDYIKIAAKYKEGLDVNKLIAKLVSIHTVKEVLEIKDAE